MSAEGNEDAWEGMEKLKDPEEKKSPHIMSNSHFNVREAKEFFDLESKKQHEIYMPNEDEIHIIYRDNYGEIIFTSVHIDALGNDGCWERDEIDWDAVHEIWLSDADFQAFYKFTQAHKIFQGE